MMFSLTSNQRNSNVNKYKTGNFDNTKYWLGGRWTGLIKSCLQDALQNLVKLEITLLPSNSIPRSRVSELFLKRPDCKYFRLVGHKVSQLINSTTVGWKQSQTIHTPMGMAASLKLYLQKQAIGLWVSLPRPALKKFSHVH